MTTRRMRNIDSEIVDSYAVQQQQHVACVHTANKCVQQALHTHTQTDFACVCLQFNGRRNKAQGCNSNNTQQIEGSLRTLGNAKTHTHTHITSPYPSLSACILVFNILKYLPYASTGGTGAEPQRGFDAAHAMPGTYCTRAIQGFGFFPAMLLAFSRFFLQKIKFLTILCWLTEN